MNASWQCGVCYSCWLPGPELRQLVFLIRLLWWSPPFSACLRISVLCTAFARASSRGLCSERICAHAPLPCMNKPQQSANIRCYHHSPRRFNWIQIRSDSASPSSVGFSLWRDKIFIFLLGWSPHGELCFYHTVWSPARSTCMSRVTRW